MGSNDSPRILFIYRCNIKNFPFVNLYLHIKTKNYICKKIMTKDIDEIIHLCGILSNKCRLRIIAALSEKKKCTSELARELEISRPLLYLHLRALEEVGVVKGKMELRKGSRVRRYYELCDFELCLNGKKIKKVRDNGDS